MTQPTRSGTTDGTAEVGTMNSKSSTDSTSAPPTRSSSDIQYAKPRRNLFRTALMGVAALAAVAVVVWIITNPRFEWHITVRYLLAQPILMGVAMTICLTVVSMIGGSALGVVLAIMRSSSFGPFRAISNGFVWFFRAVPMLVQLIFWFNLAYLLPRISIGIPFGPELVSWNTNNLITPLTAAIIGLSIHEAAYMAEIIRAGLMSVDPGQRDAAKALGYKEGTILRRIVLPQALRVIIPPTGSQFITLLKGTSLVSVIGMTELLHSAQLIYMRTFEIIPLLMTASIWYLVLVAILSMVQQRIERKLGRGYADMTPKKTGKAQRRWTMPPLRKDV